MSIFTHISQSEMSIKYILRISNASLFRGICVCRHERRIIGDLFDISYQRDLKILWRSWVLLNTTISRSRLFLELLLPIIVSRTHYWKKSLFSLFLCIRMNSYFLVFVILYLPDPILIAFESFMRKSSILSQYKSWSLSRFRFPFRLSVMYLKAVIHTISLNYWLSTLKYFIADDKYI